jgi:hypothetical protein
LNITDPDHASAIAQAVNGNLLLGSITQNIAEANDASRVGALVIDGLSGDTMFPHGGIKPILTVGEINQCEENHGDVVSTISSVFAIALSTSRKSDLH